LSQWFSASQRVLYEAPLTGRATDAEHVADDDILWLPVLPGSVQYGAAYSAEAAGDLLIDGAMWQSMVNQQYRLLSTLDGWIEGMERAHEDRTAAGIKAVPGCGHYCASKFGVVGLTNSLAVELGEFGIRVNSVHPYGTDTPMGNDTTMWKIFQDHPNYIHSYSPGALPTTRTWPGRPARRCAR